ncbi:hypothetical protein F5Y16DRAFT_30590 [Xylariaceae sp. FL0255]|nr:hypothetical protein F5Y16DRAFT_30590 [Xylariaceae sp. FL0255]
MSSNALPTPYPRHPPSNADYHVAIICALPRESAAVRAVFDKFWADHIEGDQITRECNDSNSYTVGEIGRHHVVLVHMPQYGTNNAATSAASLRSTFPAIKIALVVGVCGGIPIRGQEKQDIFLGDVIISKEIALYSLGHQFPDKFVSKDITAQGRTDNRDIQTYFAALDLQVLERNTVDFLKEAPRARERTTPHPKPSQPAPDTDKVFPSTHRHKHHIQSQCEICDRCNEERDPVCAESEKASCLELGCTGTVSRTWPKDTKGPGPRVHIGKVASGDTVMKSGGHRDRLVETREVIGFEMEGAGVMQIPCVIIKGVCDYADSHKNKAWQDYAAATAAACMKGFLAEYRPNAGIMQHFSMIDLHLLASRTQLHGDRNLTIRGMDDNPLPVSNLGQLKMTERDERRKVLFRSLSFRGMYDRESDIPDSFKDTCQWFLKTSEYCAWTQEASPNLQDRYFNNVLWIKGNPGTGKSTLMKFLLRQRRKDIRRAESNEVLISFFFNARGHDLGKTTLGLFRSLLFQLLKSRTELQFVLDDEDDVEHHDWTVGSLKDHFKTAVEHLLETTDATLVCLIDAIDEWQETQIHEMLLFFDIQSVRFRICFASRHYPKIEIPGLHIVLETQGGHGEDIASYLNGNLSFGSAYEDKASEIRSYVKTKASGIFIWVALVVRILNDDYRSGDISPSSARDRIDNLPSSLHAFFHRILTRDQSHFDELLLCLQWVLFSEAPLTPAQLYYALHASQTEKLSSWHSKEQPDDQTIKRYILHRSKGLAQSTMSEHPTVQFIHESIPDYLLKEGGLGTIWSKLQGNIAGHSHDTLKQCCIAYTSMPGIRAYVRSGLTYLDWSSNREEALNRFPLLEYANRGVLFHANQAQSESFNQLDFMESFCHRDWASQYNIIHPRKPEDFTDYTPDASLLYILAGNGMNSLIKLRRSFQSCFEIEGGIEDIKQGEKYGVPILAATGPGSGAVIRTMLELEAVRYPDFDFARFCTRFPRGFEFPQSHHRWVFNKKEDLFEQLIRHGSEIVSLFFAETVHQASRLKLLNGQRFLAHAVSRELCDLTSTLLSKLHVQVGGAEIDGRSALHLALDRENSKLTQQLIDYGAIQALPKKVRERLLLERGSIKDVQLIKQLITLGADPDAVDDEGETRLHYAASTGNTDLAQALIDKKANVSAISQNEQKTPLHLASRKGHYEVAKILIAGRANVNASTRSGRTPLHEASLGGHSRVAKMLIDNGADIEAHATLGKEDRWTSRFPHYTSAYGGREKISGVPI